MVVEILVNAVNKEHSDPVINARGCWKKGFPVVAKEQGWNWGRMESPPNFSMVTITDAPSLEAVLDYIKPWVRKTAYQILAHDPLQDFFQVKIYADPDTVGTNPDGILLAKEMHDFLLSWGADEIKDENGVVFNITAMDALNATGYINYGSQDDLVDFVEVAYDAQTGKHTISGNYSKTTLTTENIEMSIKQAQCKLLSHDVNNKTYTFEADRTIMIGYLENGVRRNFDIIIGRSQYYFPNIIVDLKYHTMTFQDLQNIIVDVKETPYVYVDSQITPTIPSDMTYEEFQTAMRNKANK